MKTFEEILQEELGKYGCVTFAHFLWKNKPNAIKLLKAVSERLANEAVKADRENRDGFYEEYMSRELIIRHWDLNNRDLPFPQPQEK
ncbi:hypothetical protein LZD49_07265 [Dyadobacter sp. CY261]|uniref:hypothetical protein n=1 Tax=Dyadobacter sp. CY261 TaxID=2907203 RepID=UPI001F1CC403|nr:hypothetical protein [Dyadobacter sp. CY261]MCF0070265.1 hypothetical protein [Dyadobacter sp. CY261]